MGAAGDENRFGRVDVSTTQRRTFEERLGGWGANHVQDKSCRRGEQNLNKHLLNRAGGPIFNEMLR